MSNTNRDYAIIYDIKNSSLILSRPLVFYITDKNTSNIFIRLVTKTNIGDGVDQYTDIENASSYILIMRVIKPNGEVTSIKATQRELESIFEFDLTENFKDIPGTYICELMISTIVDLRQELITSDSFTYEVKRSVLSRIDQIIEHEGTTVEKLLNELDASKAELSSLSSQIKETKNSWLKDINSNFIAHKGFNGTINTIKSNGIAPLNSSKSLNLAGELGFKIVEFDINILADGTWVIEHDNEIDTDNTYTSKIALDTLTLSQLKQYEMYRAYIGLGYYWEYGVNDKGYKIMTLEEGLEIVKKYDMYALIELKWAKNYQYNDSDLVNLSNTIKKVGMENKSILFTSHLGYLNTLMSHLPKSIAGLMLTSVDGSTLNNITKYQNYLALCDTDLFDGNSEFFTSNNIPVAVWTIDDYEKAEDYINRGVNFVISNYLMPANNRLSNNYELKNIYNISHFKETKDATSNINKNDDVVTFITEGYANLYKNIDSSLLNEGDIIKISCEGKTNSSNGVNYARMSVSNDGGNHLNRTSIIKFKKDNYESKSIYYVVDDKCESVTIRFGSGGNGLTGISNANIKNIKVEIYGKKSVSSSNFANERFAKLYAYDNAFLFRTSTTKYGINSVNSSGTELVINYEPFKSTANPLVFVQIDDYSRDYKYHIIPAVDNATPGEIRLKIFDADWNQITTLNSGLRISFSILIKNLE